MLLLGLIAAMGPGCQAPRLTAAGEAVTRGPSARVGGLGQSQAARLAQPLLAGEASSGGGPYNRPVSEDAIRAVEQAVRLRLEARRPKPNPCGPIPKARRMKAPTGRGDEYTGSGADVGALFELVSKLLGNK